MRIETLVLGDVRTNCYLLINEETLETIVVDPADRADVIVRKAVDEGLSLKAVFLTHGHGDHILAVSDLKRDFGVKVYAAEAEEGLLLDPAQNLSKALFGAAVTVKPDVLLEDGQVFEEAGMSFRMLFTPGHTPGGCCYYVRSEGVLFSGDTLFANSVGRTDFPGSSSSSLISAIKDKLMTLPDDTRVYPGHMGETAIGHERKNNPFLY